MAGVEEEMYLENLDEFVNDQDKIVTYKWLSRTLSVNANRAKQMLYKFVNHQQNSQLAGSKLNVSYLVGGQSCVNGETVQSYVITDAQDLEETKKQFSPVTCVHIYSVQKCRLKDFNPLYSVDYSILQETKQSRNRWSHICCKAAETLRNCGIQGTTDSRDKAQTATHKQTNGFHGPTTIGTEDKNARASDNLQTSKPHKKDNKSGMDKFTSKVPAGSNSTESSENKTKSISQKTEQAPSNSKRGGASKGSMKSFFAQRGTAASKKANDSIPSGSENKAIHDLKQGKKDLQKRTMSSSEDEEEPLSKELVQKSKESTASKAETKSKKTKRKQDVENSTATKGAASQKARRKFKAMINDSDDEDDDQKPKKKRKRMKEIPKDESSDEGEPPAEESPSACDDRDPEVQQESDSSSSIPNQQPRPVETVGSRRRKRTKVMRSKTYMNDEGFMVTEKVWESDSTDASDIEMEEKATSEIERQPQTNQSKGAEARSANANSTKQAKHQKPAAAISKPTKQASLMSFFKKN